MIELDKEFPKYGLAKHKGYITASHTAAIKEFGVLPIHRKSFANIAVLL
jgi:ribonuclease HII